MSIGNRRASSLREKVRKSALLLRRHLAQRLKPDTPISRGANLLIYNPYLSTLGGGERYILALAAYLREKCNVTIGAPELPSLQQMQRLGFQTEFLLKQIPLSCFSDASQHYDAVIYLTNTLPPPSLAKQSFLVVQFPFDKLARQPGARFRQTLGLWSYKHCIVYSTFVQQWLRTRWHRSSSILNPQIELGAFDSGSKQNLMLSVGRFFASGHCKKQDSLIAAFKLLPKPIRDSWRLVLAGGLKNDENDLAYLRQLQQDAAGHNIVFELNLPQSRLLELYGQASLFWHATGFGRPDSEPERAEHFGMTTVEAMSFGAVPMVYPDGAQPEIVTENVGLFWRTPANLATLAGRLIGEPHRLAMLARNATDASKAYGRDNFFAICAKVFG